MRRIRRFICKGLGHNSSQQPWDPISLPWWQWWLTSMACCYHGFLIRCQKRLAVVSNSLLHGTLEIDHDGCTTIPTLSNGHRETDCLLLILCLVQLQEVKLSTAKPPLVESCTNCRRCREASTPLLDGLKVHDSEKKL